MINEVDYIIIGAGSAGAVLAARLSENPAARVVLLEAGGTSDTLLHRAPIGAAALMPRRNAHNWAFDTVAQPGLGGRRGYQPRGRGLGGSSSINAMAYVRGHRSDYDHWAALGNPGWSYAEVLPYFKRAESNERMGEPFHGRSGPYPVMDQRSGNGFTQSFLDAAVQAGYRLNADFNGAEQEGFGRFQLNQVNGERCSVSRAYLEPYIGRRANLQVLTHAHACRILTLDGRACGVEFLRDGVRQSIGARGEVIVSAGVFQSPQLLMLSGIGEPTALQAAGIPVVQALPGVGRNLQDHIDFTFVSRCDHLDLAGFSLAGGARMLGQMLRWRRERRGFVASNFAEAGGFLKTRPDLSAPDVQLHFLLAMVENHGRSVRWGHGYSTHVCCLRPRSRGSVTLASADPLAAPVIDPRFLDHPADLDTLVAGFKLTRHLLGQPALMRHGPRGLNAQNLDDDDAIRAAIRAGADTVYHPVGTCAMGTHGEAVVDAHLRVHGMRGLRVVDASVMPTLIGGNTNAATVMIAEKAADLILGAG
ncbi:GMC family oxidoreductase [Rugamonas apoptosis]|uniref:GMC family oxidoreductase n=1 Tax=Rugamonas apoptosis TaxID=2758570 RepID=UPI002883323F|nr:GMC family oxidoreductase N-terminal domain-containing protein [Rugamonas apoptosis]